MSVSHSTPSKRTEQNASARQDYDSPWKEIRARFFPDFMAFFFPDIRAAIDWSRGFEFLDTEMQKIIVEAAMGRRLADKLVKVYLLDRREVWLLIHIEAQGKREEGFAKRMLVYHYRIFEKHEQHKIMIGNRWRRIRIHSRSW